VSQFINFGGGGDGNVTLSGTDSPIDSACNGTAGATSLSATNGSFAAGQMIFIHQTQGTGNTQWEVNYIVSYSAGTITTLNNLDYTYASGAQVLVVKQYSSISGSLTAKSWNGSVGGIIALACTGQALLDGTFNLAGKGFRGAGGGSTQQQTGRQGEGTAGATYTRTTSANGNGGGGGLGGGGDASMPASGGAGGGNGATGSNSTGVNGGTPATGGSAVGSADLTTMSLGGAGGEGGTRNNTSTDNAVEGFGGGMFILFARIITVTGSVSLNGGNATRGDSPYGEGGGAGGSALLKGQRITLGTNQITALGGAQEGGGGDGAVGRTRIEACSRTGSTNPAASESIGGFNFCGGASAIIG